MFTRPFGVYQGHFLNAVIYFGLFPKEIKSGYLVVSARNCLASTLKKIVMQLTKETGAIV